MPPFLPLPLQISRDRAGVGPCPQSCTSARIVDVSVIQRNVILMALFSDNKQKEKKASCLLINFTTVLYCLLGFEEIEQ